MKPILITRVGERHLRVEPCFDYAVVQAKAPPGRKVRARWGVKDPDEDREPCPDCGEKPWRVKGEGPHFSHDDRAYEAEAISLCCRRYAGTLRVEANTIFGVREDAEILSGKYGRVY